MEREASLGGCCGKRLEYLWLHCRIASFTTWESAEGQCVPFRGHLNYPFWCHVTLFLPWAGFLSAQRTLLSGRREVVGRVLFSRPRQLFPGEHRASRPFQLTDVFLKCLSGAPWILMGF